jgi:two-component system, LytTR family, response regulator
MRCIIVDDEPLAHEILSDYISKNNSLELVNSYTNPIEAFSSIERDKIELIFLDVQMPELTGIQFLKLLGDKCKVILTTAYPEYALDGYEHNVVDYLLKPISFERFQKACVKLMSNTNNASIEEERIELDHLFVKTEHKIIRIDLSSILYIEGLKDYISIYTATERILTLMNMKKVEELLPTKRFIRVHKSYIVSLEKIDSIEKNRIYIAEQGIPIGDTYKEEFYIRLEGK